MKPRSLLHPITERKSDICAPLSLSVPDLRIIILFIEIYPAPETSLVKFEQKLASFHHVYTRRFSREQFSPAFVVRENASATSKTFDPVARLSPWNFEGGGAAAGEQQLATYGHRSRGKLIYWRLPPGKNSAATRYYAPLTGKRNAIDSATARFITSKDNGGPPTTSDPWNYISRNPAARFILPDGCRVFFWRSAVEGYRSLFIRLIVGGWTWWTTPGKSDFDVYVNDNDIR